MKFSRIDFSPTVHHQVLLGITHRNTWYFMKVNERIRRLREMNDLTQEEMANKLNLSTNGYANLERAETKVHLSRLEEIAQVFQIDVTELLSFGERSLTFYDNSTNHGFNIIGGESLDKNWIVELSKSQTIIQHKDEVIKHKDELIQHKDEIIQQKNQEIETLKQMIELLKAK